MKRTYKVITTFTEGNEYPFYNENGEISMGTIWKCEKCDNLCHVNSLLVLAPCSSTIHWARIMKLDVVSELSANEEGDNLCSECYWKWEKENEARQVSQG